VGDAARAIGAHARRQGRKPRRSSSASAAAALSRHSRAAFGLLPIPRRNESAADRSASRRRSRTPSSVRPLRSESQCDSKRDLDTARLHILGPRSGEPTRIAPRGRGSLPCLRPDGATLHDAHVDRHHNERWRGQVSPQGHALFDGRHVFMDVSRTARGWLISAYLALCWASLAIAYWQDWTAMTEGVRPLALTVPGLAYWGVVSVVLGVRESPTKGGPGTMQVLRPAQPRNESSASDGSDTPRVRGLA